MVQDELCLRAVLVPGHLCIQCIEAPGPRARCFGSSVTNSLEPEVPVSIWEEPVVLWGEKDPFGFVFF